LSVSDGGPHEKDSLWCALNLFWNNVAPVCAALYLLLMQ
jgi:hypothetical protein